jgi:rhodanese-related sulfurtransferase
VVDVRDEFEIDGDPVGLHMPMHQVRERFSALPVGAPVLFVCDKGMRSTVVARMLRKESGFMLAYSLRGGLNRLA